MKLSTLGKYESLKVWAFGLYACGKNAAWTLVIMIGTNWWFELKRSKTAFGLCFGPLTIGGAR